MKANKITIMYFIIVVIAVTGLYLSQQTTPEIMDSSTVTFLNGTVVEVGIADDPDEQRRGLSFRESLGHNNGLLFIHDPASRPSYWMKDMHFAIDIIWIKNRTIVGFSENLFPENPPTTLYRPPTEVNYVLEVNAGFVEENGLKIGEKLDIRFSEE